MSTTPTSNIGPPVSFGLAKPSLPYGITPGQFGITAMTIFTTWMSQMNYWIWHPSIAGLDILDQLQFLGLTLRKLLKSKRHTRIVWLDYICKARLAAQQS
jgi:hypothetical protein